MERIERQWQEKPVIGACCVCAEVRDDIAVEGGWYDLEAYLSRYGFQETDLVLSHTFCPPCFVRYKHLNGLEG